MKKVLIQGIGGGRATSRFFPRVGEFTSSTGIDPDLPIGSEHQASGLAVPAAYSKFSGTNVDSPVVNLITSPKNTKVYAILKDGRIVSYSTSLGSETLVGTVAGSNAGGATYYNNYIYIFGTGASKDDVSRYGPLDGSPSIADNVWKGATLGSQTALTNTTYPTTRLINYPNHWGYSHSDNSLYFLDFSNGQGLVHRIHTMTSGGVEGSVNSTTVPSAYNVLDLPIGYYPTSLAGYGTSVAIAAIQSTTNDLDQGPASLFIWNPTNDTTFDQQIAFPDPLATALLYKYGRLFCFSGTGQLGIRVSEYAGGSTLSELYYLADGTSPMPGAVEAQGKRIMFGSFCLDPVETACVYALNSRTQTSANSLQNIATVGTTGSSVDQIVTAIKLVSQQNSGNQSFAQLVIANNDDSNHAIYQKVASGANTIQSVLLMPMVVVGSNFRIDRIRIPLGTPMVSGSSMELTILYDDGATQTSALTISNGTFPGANRVTFKTPVITGSGQNNFILKFNMSGTNASIATAIAFPIEVRLEVFDDELLSGTST